MVSPLANVECCVKTTGGNVAKDVCIYNCLHLLITGMTEKAEVKLEEASNSQRTVKAVLSFMDHHCYFICRESMSYFST